jgi:hypothetical protein
MNRIKLWTEAASRQPPAASRIAQLPRSRRAHRRQLLSTGHMLVAHGVASYHGRALKPSRRTHNRSRGYGDG